MTLNEDLIRDALFRAKAEDLDGVLTTIEAYQTCIQTAARLVRKPSMDGQRQRVLECVHYCEDTLGDYAAAESTESLHYPERDLAGARFLLVMHLR